MPEGDANEQLDSEKLVVQKGDLLIQQKIYDMILYAYPALEQMPKSQKFSLASEMKHKQKDFLAKQGIRAIWD